MHYFVRVRCKSAKGGFKVVRKLFSGEKKYMAMLKRARRVLKGATQAEVQERARLHALEAIDALAKIIKSDEANDTAKNAAASLLFERGYGKPTQTNINASVNTDGAPREITGDELEKRIRETIARVEGISQRKREKIISPEGPADLRKLH